MSHENAHAAVSEAKLLLNSEGDKEQINDALELALKDLRGEEVTDADFDSVHPAVAHRLRDQGFPKN